jgi:hypothetical protein
VEFVIELRDGPEEVLVTASGAATVEGLRELIEALTADERLTDVVRYLLDYSRLDFTEMSLAGVHARAENIRSTPATQPARIAIVAGSTVDYGLQRQFTSLAGDDTPLVMRPFTSIEAARAWLAETDPEA